MISAVKVIIMKKVTEVENTGSSVLSVFFGRYSVFFGICNTDVGIGIGIWKYRGICSVSVLATYHYYLDLGLHADCHLGTGMSCV